MAESLNNLASVLQSLGKPAPARSYYEQALAMYQKLYPAARFPDGHPRLATSLNNLGSVFESLGQLAPARGYYEQALAMRQKLYPAGHFPDGHPDLAESLNNMASVLQSLGRRSQARSYCEQALAMYQKLYPATRFPNGHPDLARGLSNLGFVLRSLGQPAPARSYYEQALAMYQKLYPADRFPDGHPDLAHSLNNLGRVLESLGQSSQACGYYEQELAMRQKLYPVSRFPGGHPDLAESLNNLGFVFQALGQPSQARSHFEQALAMNQKLYPAARFPDGHPDLALSLNNLGHVLQALGQPSQARSYFEQALAMNQKLYPAVRFPDGHVDLAGSLDSMGSVLWALGQPSQACSYYEQALAMYQRLYPVARFPDGHPDLARSLNNLGFALQSLRQLSQARSYYEQAFAMNQKLYPAARLPDGHPHLATSLNNLGRVLELLGQPSQARSYYEQALAMRQKLYPPARFPDGHPDLARSLNNLGLVLRSLGQPSQARSYSEQALAMRQKLYPAARFPDGHPELAGSLTNLGLVLQALGQVSQARSYYEQALAMYGKVAYREMSHSSEATALAYQLSQPPTRGLYLSVAVRMPASSSTYAYLWHARGSLLPLLQARHRAVLALARTSDSVRTDYGKLVSVRQQISRLQQAFPNNDQARMDCDRRLVDLNNEQDRLESQLAAALPAFQHLRELAHKGPADLAQYLPQDAALVDFIRYRHWEKDKYIGRRYVAFVLVPGKEAKLVELGDATPIDDAVAAWRRRIDAGQESLAPAQLRALVWEKIAQELSPQTRRIYLCPDGELTRLPFAALPGKGKGTVLLEEYQLALVPSGPWLLEQRLYPPPPSDAPDRVLAVGAVAYGKGMVPSEREYPLLAGTAAEQQRVLEAFGQEARDGLSGAAATTRAVREHLTQVRYAHLATHGYFDAQSLNAERARLQKYLQQEPLSVPDSPLAGLGLRNPAGYVGLVLAGANDPARAGPDGGILTGLGIVDLPLENLRLCVLSACETGLGELTEGEGVLGLQRAFHAAGCANVVGTLWRVDDAATAALMAQFYRELRTNGRPPLAALREAQLAFYRHPQRILALASKRGPIDPGVSAQCRLQGAADAARRKEPDGAGEAVGRVYPERSG